MMNKRLRFISILVFLLIATGLRTYSANYDVHRATFKGFLSEDGSIDWLDIKGWESRSNITICLRHGSDADFDFAIFNDSNMVGINQSMEPYSCSSAYAPAHVQVKVWSVHGRGEYTITIPNYNP